jgi:hypothetical protein
MTYKLAYKELDIDPYASVKKGVWIYFFLLLFEGALRKWILPGLATPLLIIRDPVALWILFMLWNKQQLPKSNYMVFVFGVGIASCIATMLFGHRNLFVMLYGARILLIHFPLMFAIGKIFDYDDVIKLGKVLLWISIPMAILIALQFYSPQSAFVNRGVGGDESGGGFSGALGFFRPPATFSFTNGTTLFFGLLAPFVIYFWLNPEGVNKILLSLASAALVASIPLSISRSLLFSIIICVVFAVFATARNVKYAKKLILAAIVLFVAAIILSQASFFQTAIQAFTSRFENASNYEGGIEGTFFNRYLGGMLKPFSSAFDQPFFGYGMGMGTSVGSLFLTGKATFLLSEGEWGRLIGEMGPFMGIGVILVRVLFCINILAKSYNKMIADEALGWMLVSVALVNIPQSQWSQPTALGFSTLIGGLILSVLKGDRNIANRLNLN